MYKVPETKMDILLQEGTRLVDKLSHSSTVCKSDISQFGNALLEVQTECYRQKSDDQIKLEGLHV